MRLLDRIFTEGLFSYKVGFDARKMLEELKSAQLVVIDNVAAYYLDELKQHLDNAPGIKSSDFPTVMLPFEKTFLEMRIRRGDVIGSSFEECGVLFQMFQPGEVSVGKIESTKGTEEEEAIKAIVFHEDVAYHLSCSFFAYGRGIDKAKALYTTHLLLPITAEGKIFADGEGIGVLGQVYTPDNADTGKMLDYFETVYLAPCLLAISFMHCRNVRMVEEAPPQKLSKKFQKRTGRPLLRYRVLQIDHAKEMLEREGHVKADGLKRALHICRGHFVEYGKDGKGLLFGKHEGRFWIPMHTRGKLTEGVVVKDYEVK